MAQCEPNALYSFLSIYDDILIDALYYFRIQSIFLF